MRKKLYSLLLVAVMAVSIVACGNDNKETAETVEQSTVDSAKADADDAAEAEAKPEEAEDKADAKTDEAGDKEAAKLDLEDGEYTVEFTTDSPMFHINEAYDNKATLTVKDGVGTVHITLTSKKIVNLYPGVVADVENDADGVLQPTTDEVTYDDGTTDEVNGFDVPVPAIDEEFDLALIGTKGTWYDHKVKVSNPTKE